jgi:hypothetical protein
MRTSLDKVKDALEPDSKLTFEEKVELAKSIGRSEAARKFSRALASGNFSLIRSILLVSQESELMKQFSDLAKHLDVLIDYLTEKRKPLYVPIGLICDNFIQSHHIPVWIDLLWLSLTGKWNLTCKLRPMKLVHSSENCHLH